MKATSSKLLKVCLLFLVVIPNLVVSTWMFAQVLHGSALLRSPGLVWLFLRLTAFRTTAEPFGKLVLGPQSKKNSESQQQSSRKVKLEAESKELRKMALSRRELQKGCSFQVDSYSLLELF